MKQLTQLYQQLGYQSFYDIILSNIQNESKEFIVSPQFLEGWNVEKITSKKDINCKIGDVRIDVPVWFGNKQKAKNRVLIFGLEPRDTDSKFNIERVGEKVFATPFGVDRWNPNSTVFRKPQNKYYRVFENVVSDKANFVVFSDIVKDYELVGSNDQKNISDENARDTFFFKAEKALPFLVQEINHIDPTHILVMGKDSYQFLSKAFKSQNIIQLRHPSKGGEKIAKEQIMSIFY
jgi:hypothetical protein